MLRRCAGVIGIVLPLFMGCSEGSAGGDRGSVSADMTEGDVRSEDVILPEGAPPEAKDILGEWMTSIPGVAYETPSQVDGYNTLNVSPGVRDGALLINPDGTYEWSAYGGKTGAWKAGDADYPVVLIDTVENKEWRVGLDRGKLVIWDGSIWYEGVR